MIKKHSHIIWSLFSSVKLAIILLIILAATSIVGTVIPQREGAVEFAMGMSPGMFRLFSSLNLFDIYHSILFRLILGCLALNLVVCSLDRLPGIWKRFNMIPRPDRDRPFENIDPGHTFFIHGDLKEISDHVRRFFSRRYRKTLEKGEPDRHSFLGEKGGYSLFGVYLVHTSILIILVGALIGSMFGFEAYVNIVEGEKTDTVKLRQGMRTLNLGFEVRCDDFRVDFYKNGAPREYRSTLTFLVNGKEAAKRVLLVNHPVRFMDITFYQSSYGTVPGRRAHLQISRKAGKHERSDITLEQGKPIRLPGDEGDITLMEVRTDMMGTGPAASILIRPDQGDKVRLWIFKDPDAAKRRLPAPMLKSAMFNPAAFRPYTFFLKGIEKRYYTGLQVNKDPGVPVVWLGCVMMITGLFVAFFTSRRHIWVRLSREDHGVRISVAGTATKNPVGLQRELDHLTRSLEELWPKKERTDA